jgi:hypothetical protein
VESSWDVRHGRRVMAWRCEDAGVDTLTAAADLNSADTLPHHLDSAVCAKGSREAPCLRCRWCC